MKMENFISVATFPSEVEAQVAKATLSAAHIESFIHNDDAGNMLPSLEQSNGVQLLVDTAMAEEARIILTTPPSPAPDQSAEDFNSATPGTV